ncbi:PREDICTED: mitochondrial ribonuclease P protein 3 [Dinoponera quadriceps]|uniref:Mitochondrial ribonuclease P catalytic subunit n=1 Tax=Dinoponera quadriceps TaxID=609295 RepID=A0A6P3XWA2_DINQU|nr:PREDICTED: mitochondrial ribonuclease P protein 3 [Dinoponera quadriceps]XP_014482188.1 PREDICTED: mitochondrial ribonuclease P protein 3 [Dinoponera quadriceps]
MAVYRRLCQSLWAWSCKYQRRAYYRNLQDKNTQADEESELVENSRKVVSMKVLIRAHQELYNKMMNDELSSKDWQDIRENILQKPLEVRPVTATTVDSVIIDLCLNGQRLDKAMEYCKFLKERHAPLNVAIIGKYLRLFVLKRDSLTDSDKQDIVATCNALLEKYPCLDSITAEHCISSLCLTDQWEKSIKILEMINLTMKPGRTVYSMIASAAFQHDRPDIGWDATQRLISRALTPQNVVYTSYLQYCEHGADQGLFDDRLEDIFSFWAENGEKPYKRVLNAFAEVAGKHGWSAAPTSLSNRGECGKCHYSLSDLKFSRDTFQELVDAFMKRVIVGSDIYFTSNPRELRKFMEFVERTKPYDIVIDGLNITYTMKKVNPRSLPMVVEHFVKRDQKVLVLTRKHQKKLSMLNYVQQHAYVFWTDNLSMDDPYLLYATLASGENAMFVSSDLMRRHKSLLQDKRLQWVFKKWQCSHQYFTKSRGPHVQITSPYNFMPHSQKNSDSWHIPYISDDSTNPDTHEFPDLWYCFHKKRK